MDMIDDVLDLVDSLGEAFEKSKRGAKRVLRGEAGFGTLVTVLVILALGAIIITPLLVLVVTGQRAGTVHKETTHRYYAADAGIQDGMWRVTSGDLPPWMKEDWDESVYAHALDDDTFYQLPDQINGNDVTVKIRAMWLLEGLEDPSADQGRTPDPGLVIVSNILGGGQMQIVMICTSPTTTSLNRIGVWIPKSVSYVNNSSNLGSFSPVITQSEWRNGHIITFDFSSAVSFSSLPGGTGNRRVITFNYTPSSGSIDTSWAWCRTTGTDPKLAWSDDIKLYQIESAATNPETGQSTTVISQTMTNQSIGTYLAYYGDYTLTGNALLRDHDKEGRYRERMYKETPGEVSVIPASGTAKRILLYWSGWKTFPENVFYGGSSDVGAWSQDDQDRLEALAANYRVNKVSARVEYNGTNYNLGTVQATKWTVLPNGSTGSPNGWSYGCQADITALVLDALPDGFVGNGKYWIGHADLGTSPPSDDTIQGIWGSSSSNVFIVGDSGTILQYNGTSWSPMASGTTSNLIGVWGSDATHIWAVGASSAIRKYTGSWAGQTRSDGRTETLRAVWGSSATDVWVVGDTYRRSSQNRYTLLHTTNGGTSWTNTGDSMTGGVTMNGIWGSASNNVFAVGNSGRILRYTTGWATMSVPSGTGNLYGVWGSSASDVFAVGANGRILRYNGTSWSTMGVPSGFTSTLYGVWGSSANDVFAVGADGRILHYSGSGSWTEMASGSIEHLYGAWGSGSSDVYAVGVSTGTASTILHYDGSVWSAVTSGYQVYGWVNSHSGETVVGQTAYRLGDNVVNEWANGAWSIVVLYTSPVTLAHQMYLYDTFRYWNSNDDRTFTIEGFLAPAGIASESDAVKITCFVGEGDSIYTGENVWLNGTQVNTGAAGTALASNNVWNQVSNSGGVAGYPPDGLDLDTFTISGPSGIIKPADSLATVRMKTGTDIWNLVYMIISFRSDKVGSGLVTYIVE